MPHPSPLCSARGAHLRLLSFAFLAVAACTTSGPIEGTDAGDVATDADVPDATTDGSQVDASDADRDSGSPDAAPPQGCSGKAASCFGRDALGCSLGIGCSSRHLCVGTASACLFQVEPSTCAVIHGCSWDAAMGKCTGRQIACNARDTPESCDDQPGCAATIACQGTITPCANLPDQAMCQQQAGCLWTP